MRLVALWFTLSFALLALWVGVVLVREYGAQLHAWWRRSELDEMERVATEILNALPPHRRRWLLAQFAPLPGLDDAEQRRARFERTWAAVQLRMADDKAVEALLASCGIKGERR